VKAFIREYLDLTKLSIAEFGMRPSGKF